MNRIFKTVWSAVRRCYVAVNEASGTAQSRGKAAGTAIVVASALAVALPANADTRLYNWDHYTGTNDWSNNIDAANYGNDSTDVTMSGTRVYDRVAIGRRSGSHIYGGKTPCDNSTTGYCAVAPGYLTDGSNLTLAEGADVTVKGNMWVFGTVFIDRTAADDGDDRDDYGGFGTDLRLSANSKLTVGGTLDVGTHNSGNSSNLYQDWDEVILAPGSAIYAGNITGVARFTVNNATIESQGTLGTLGYSYVYGNKNYGGSLEPYSRYYISNNSLVKTHTLDSNVIIEISDSTLQADVVGLTSQTVNGTTSTFKTTLGAVASLTTKSKTVDSIGIDGNGRHTLDGASLGTTQAFGGLNTNFTDNVIWSDGAFVFEGTYAQSVADAATQAIHDAFGTTNSVIFGEVVADAPELGNGLTTAQINTLLAANGNPERILYTTVWDQQSQNNTVTTGSSDTAIGVSVGFKNLKNDALTTVTNGKTLVLLGDGTDLAVADGVLVADNGTLQLGVSSVISGGSVKEVHLANNGTLKVNSGTFSFGTVAGNGQFVIDQSAVANFNAHNVEGSMTNNGTMNIAGALTFAEDSTLTSSGQLTTNQDNIFQNVTPSVIDPLNVINLSAQLPEEIRVVANDLFRKYVPGEVAEALADHATFTGGKVTITGVNLTNTQVADLTQAFKEKFGNAVEIEFQGKIEGVSVNDVLNVAKVNELADANIGLTEVVYVDRQLEGENKDVVVSNSGLKTNSGFTGINDAADVTIADGKKLVLIGEKDNASFNLVESTSTPTVRGGATLELGTLGLADGADYKGTLAAVNLGETNETGRLNVVNGNYTVNEVIARNQGSEVTVGTAGTLNATKIIANTGADITNNGTLMVSGDVETTGNGEVTNSSEMTINGLANITGTLNNNKNLTIGNGLTVVGALTNASNSELQVTGATNISGTGVTFQNAGHAVLNGDLNVIGTLRNTTTGHLETNKMFISGTLINNNLIDASDTSELYGTLTNNGTINLYDTVVGQRGEVNNTHTITGIGTITVNGLLSNVNNADFTGEDLILTTVLAGSQEAGSEISTLAGSVPTITNEATMTFENVTIGADTEFYNYGSTSSDTLTVEEGGYYINQTKPSTSGIMLMADAGATEVRRETTISGQYTNAGDAYLGTVDITATGVATNTGNLYTGESTQVVDGTGITIAAGGQLLNSGTAVLASSMTNAGTIRGDGTLTFKRGGTGTNIFANTGTINVGNFATDGEITYNQSGATSDFTSESGWFTNAVINLAEGTMSHENAGSGNTYNLGVQGDAVIANQATATFDAIDSSNVFNIYTGSTLDVGTITLTENEKTVNLLGGTLSTTLDQIFGDIYYTATDMDANSPDDLVDVDGVKVATGVGDMKDSIAQGVQFGWGTMAFDDAVYSASVVSDVLTKLDANDLAIGGHEGVGVEGGLQVTFNGQASQTFNVDLANGVKARPAGTEEAYGSAYAVFTGETLTNTTQAHPDYTAIYVGAADQAAANGVVNANILDNNIGFKQVVNVAGGMTVADGRQFVFVGENQTVPGDYALIDGDLSIVRDGLVTLGSYGTREATKGDLKNVAIDDGTLRVRHGSFTADAVTSAGTIYVGGDGQVHDGLMLNEDTDSSLTVQSYQANVGSNLVNWGTFAADSMTSGGSNSGTITNYGLLDVGTADIDMVVTNLKAAEFDALTLSGGTLENGEVDAEGLADMSLTATTLTAKDGSVVNNYATMTADTTSISGRYQNAEGATADLGALTVAGKGLLANSGTVNVDSITQTGGTVQNGGEMTIAGTTASSIAATFNNTDTLTIKGETLTIADGAVFTNAGTMTSTANVEMTGGALNQNSDTAISLTNLTISGGKLSVAEAKAVNGTGNLVVNTTAGAEAIANSGTIDFANITVTQGKVTGEGTFGSDDSVLTVEANGSVDQANVIAATLTNAGSVTADNLTVGTGTNTGNMSLADSLTGVLGNDGSLTIEGSNGFAFNEGTLTNNGTLTATEDVTLGGGHLVQASDTTAIFDDLTIEDGDLTVNADKTVEGNQLIIRTDAADSVAVANNGTVDFNRINVESGSVTGTGTLGAADSTIGVFENGSVTQGRVEGNAITVENGATVTADNFVSHGNTSWNKGVITTDDADFGERFTNEISGEITVADSMTGNLMNVGNVTLEGENGLTFTDGKLTNNGVLTATEKVTVGDGAVIEQMSDTEASFTDVEVIAGQFNTTEGKVSSGDNLTINMTAGADVVGSVNNGVLDFGSIHVAQGQITGTGTLGSESASITVDAAGTVSQGQVVADSLNNAGAITGNVTADHGANSGTISAGDLTIEGTNGQFTNTGTITTTGTAAVAGLDNQKDVTFGNGATLTGTNSNTGSMTSNGGALNVAGGTTTVSGTGSLTANAGLTVGEEGSVAIEGENAVAAVTGGATIDGTFETSGQTTIDKIAGESSGTIVAAGGSLSIGDLTETDGMTFTQTADTNLIVDKGWFENSTINIEGGHFDASVIHDDEGNASGMLGHNTVNIGKTGLDAVVGPDSELPAVDKVDWSDKYVVVKVDTVTSDTTINVASGGVLDVDNITLTPENGAGQTITVGTGGGIQTSLDQFFDKVSTTVIDIEAIDPETGKVDIITDVIATTTVTDVKDSIKDGLKFENGSMVAWDDEDWSIELVTSTSNSLTEAGLISEDVKVQQHFLGDFMGEFTVDTAHRLEEEQLALGNSHVLEPGVVFDTTTLHNVTVDDQDANRELVIGMGQDAVEAGQNGIDYSIGFKDVANADSVTVTNGKEFVLVGGSRAEDFDWTTGYDDSNKLLVDAADGGSASVTDGTLTLGSNGVTGATAGWINSADIAEAGNLVTKNGEFAVWEITNAGNVNVTEGSILHTNVITNTGSVNVAGGLTVEDFNTAGGSVETGAGSVTTIGNLTTDADSSLVNAGTVTIDTLTDGKLLGTIANNGKDSVLDVASDMTFVGSLTSEGTAHYKDVTIEGTWVNSGLEVGEDLVVSEGSTHTNTGTSIWNTVEISGSGMNGEELGDGPKGNEEGFKSDSILGIGSDAADETFDIAGDYTNHGIVDASKAEDTNVTGSLVNDGQGLYDDMTITAGGSSVNDGYEKGDILTVEDGTHSNTGTSIWNNITIGENASGTNGEELGDGPKGHEEGFTSDSIMGVGSDEADDVFEVAGDFDNHGKLDATKAEDTLVSGDIHNDGQANYDDMDIVADGSSVNDGYEKGDILTVEEGGSHTNTGTSIWNNAQIGGSATNDGNTVVGGEGGGDEFVVNGDYTNNGNLDATDAENTVIAGDLDNNGHAEYDDMDINDGGTSTNDVYEKGDILDVNDGGKWDQNGESHWNNVNINEGGSGSNSGELTVEEDLVIAGDFDNTGDVDTGNLIVNEGGVLDLGDGSIDAETTTVNGGDIIVGNHKELADENRVDYDTVVNGSINGHFWVIGNGDLSFGKDADKLAEELGVPDIPDVHNRLTVSQTVTIGETGSIAVGSDVWTDKNNHKDVGDGNLYFGSDSTTVIDTSVLANGGSIFTGTKDGATVTVEDGATLVLGNLDVAGDYVITSGFETAGNTDENGWIGGWTEDALWAPVDAGSGLKWELTLGWDETKVWVTATLEDILNQYPDISIPDNINDSLESCKNAGGPDQVLACTVIRNPDLSKEDKTRIINSVAEIGYASGAMAMAFNEATMAADSIEGRLSMKAEAFNRDGSMKDGSTGLWVDVLGSWTNADSYSVSGNADIGYDADSYGIIMGVDHKLKDKNVILGGAFSYTDGNLTSTGDLLETKNAFKTFGIHAYGAWKPSDKTNLVGMLSYLRSASEASQKLPSAAGFGSASADIDTDLFVAGVRGEMLFNVSDNVQIVPHLGARMIVGSTDGYDTKLDGRKAYGNDADTTTTFQIPVGVAVRGDFVAEGGWTVRPVADLTVIPQFGDTEQDTQVTGTSGATDEVTGQFTGDFATAISVGFQVESQKDTTIGFRYGLTAGEEGRKDHQLKFELRKLF